MSEGQEQGLEQGGEQGGAGAAELDGADLFAKFAAKKDAEMGVDTGVSAAAGDDAGGAEPEVSDGSVGSDRSDGGAQPEETHADPWATASPELVAERDRMTQQITTLNHQAQSAVGRQSVLQQQLNKLQQSTGSSEAPSAKELSAAVSSPEKFKAFKEDYPETAEALESLILADREKLRAEMRTELQQVVSPLIEAEQDRLAKAEERRLETPLEEGGYGHKDWKSVINSPGFVNWMQQQPAQVQALANSPQAADANWLLTRFKADTAQPVTNGETQQAATGKITDIKEQRQRRLEQGAGIPSRTRTDRNQAGDAGSSDKAALFKKYAKKKDLETAGMP